MIRTVGPGFAAYTMQACTIAVGFAGDEPENPILVAVESPRMHDRSNAEGATIDSFIGSTANVFVHSKFCPHR